MIEHPARKIVALLAHHFFARRDQFTHMRGLAIVVRVAIQFLPSFQKVGILDPSHHWIRTALKNIAGQSIEVIVDFTRPDHLADVGVIVDRLDPVDLRQQLGFRHLRAREDRSLPRW